MSPAVPSTRTRRTGSTVLGGAGRLRTELRRRRSRRSRTVAALVVVLLVLLAAVGGWLVGFSSVLTAEQVVVQGQRELTDQQVQEAAAVPSGMPLARVDLDAVAGRVAALPQVASARATRDWPHTVVVTVTERQPVLAVQQPEGYAVIDDRGVAYETRPTIPAGVLQADADPTATRLLTDLAVVTRALPEDLRPEVDRIGALSAADIVLTLDGGATVRWGDASESPLKGQVVAALLTDRTRAIDVSAPHNPATR